MKLNKLGLLGAFNEYPIFFDFNRCKKITNHEPLKPVHPGTNTFLLCQNFGFKNI